MKKTKTASPELHTVAMRADILFKEKALVKMEDLYTLCAATLSKDAEHPDCIEDVSLYCLEDFARLAFPQMFFADNRLRVIVYHLVTIDRPKSFATFDLMWTAFFDLDLSSLKFSVYRGNCLVAHIKKPGATLTMTSVVNTQAFCAEIVRASGFALIDDNQIIAQNAVFSWQEIGKYMSNSLLTCLLNEMRNQRQKDGSATIVSSDLAHELTVITKDILKRSGRKETGTSPSFSVPDADAVVLYCSDRLKNWKQ